MFPDGGCLILKYDHCRQGWTRSINWTVTMCSFKQVGQEIQYYPNSCVNWIAHSAITESFPSVQVHHILFLCTLSPSTEYDFLSTLWYSSCLQTLLDKWHAIRRSLCPSRCGLSLSKGRLTILASSGSSMGWSASNLSSFGYQFCVGQCGAIKIMSALSLSIFCRVFPNILKGGKA